MKKIKEEQEISKTLDRIACEILERHEVNKDFALIGIRSRGVPMAERLIKRMEEIAGVKAAFGELDITLYRDDLSQVADAPVLNATKIPFDITGKTLVLTDDVLYTGRTVKSALAALSDLGRAKRVELAALVDRGHRELPVRADYIGYDVPTSSEEVIGVRFKEQDGEDAVYIFLGNEYAKSHSK